MNSDSASVGFYYAKFIAILIVATGHYFDGSLLWIPATVSLFVFGFASGYFTAGKHGERDIYRFWAAKLRRLGPTLIVTGLFLTIIFVLEGRPGIVSWQSLISVIGLSGLFDWLGIRNASPFGSGLWFLTVLWLFYLVYPLLAVFCRTVPGAWSVVILSFLVCTLGHFYASPPYALWPTVFSFVFGIFVRRVGWNPGASRSFILAIVVTLVMLVVNVFGIKLMNYYLLLAISILVVGFLLSFDFSSLRMPRRFGLAACVFEIYLIHTYLFIRTDSVIVGYVSSMALVLLAAYCLNRATGYLSTSLGGQSPSVRSSS